MHEHETQEDSGAPAAARDEAGYFSSAFVEAVGDAIENRDRKTLRDLCQDLHNADLADLIEQLDQERRTQLIQLLGRDFDFAVLTEVDDTVREQILEALPVAAVAAGLRDLDSDDAVYILEDLADQEQEEILARIPEFVRVRLRRSLDYPEETAGRRMQSDVIAVPPFWDVGRTIDYMRESDDLPDEFYELIVVDPSFRPVGTVPLNRLLRTKRPVRIDEIMDTPIRTIRGDLDQEEAARIFERYNLVSAAIVDDSNRLVGVIHHDDIIDVIEEEAEEDIRGLVGLGDEEISDNFLYTARSRFPWLFINLWTAMLAASVIGLFDESLEKMVALAVLMPIVASMGGNAGTQTMTVTVRALATRELGGFNKRRIFWRELLVALLNGVTLAILIGIIAALWFSNAELGGVIGAALVFNLLVAGSAGFVVPVLLDRFGADPAVASSVFLTTVTDVVGFFAFLGLATLLLL
ncbi:magnesium transporter [Lutibaculum baratangense]|uniref:magnesium transporter n=1 Tax=Lutibaculum baratangense TaxID=1358440 RepID=UPI0009DF0F4A|nr:magnesium transporter [Lutibaculum baratangense]